MSLLSADELRDLKGEQENALPDTCVLRAKTRVTTKTGSTYTEATVATEACRIGPLSQEEQIAANRLGITVDAVIAFRDGAPILPTYRIVTGGLTYEIVAPDLDRTYRTANTVRVKRVSAGA